MAPGKEKKIAGGTGGQKTGPLFSRVPRGTLSVVNLDPVYPKKYRRGILSQKSGVPQYIVNLIIPYFTFSVLQNR